VHSYDAKYVAVSNNGVTPVELERIYSINYAFFARTSPPWGTNAANAIGEPIPGIRLAPIPPTASFFGADFFTLISQHVLNDCAKSIALRHYHSNTNTNINININSCMTWNH
jgi:hypothetical protein